MKTPHLLFTAALTTLACGLSSTLMAQTPAGKTREQVRQELQEAIRTGNVQCNNDSGMLEREANPSRYPAVPEAPGKSREQVQQELQEAIRTGNVPANDESGRLLREVNPELYPSR